MGGVRKVIKAVLWVLATTIGLTVAGYLFVLVINLEDRPPSESVARIKEITASITQIENDDNAYVYINGFSIVKGEDPKEWGERRIAWALQVLKEPFEDKAYDFPGEDHDFRGENEAVIDKLLEGCKEVDRACLELVKQNEESILDWMDSNDWLLERYQTLLIHPGWYEAVPYDVRLPLPNYRDVLDAQMLLFAKAWVAAGNSDASTVKSLLEKDVRFWREVLASSDVLITKMIAVAALKRHFSWSSAILHRLPSDVVLDGVPVSWSNPISKQERSMLRCMLGEWEFANDTIRHLKNGDFNSSEWGEWRPIYSSAVWFFVNPMLKSEDSSGRYAELILETVDILDVTYEQYPRAIGRVQEVWNERIESAFPSRIYNLTGDYLFASSMWDLASYSVRVSDLEGIRRIAVAAIEFRSRGILSREIADELPKVETRNPYTEEPFIWDDTTGAIVFQGLESGESGRHWVLY
jgi:hypothetical protein